MSYIPKILAFAGSTRSGSFNKQLVKVGIRGAEAAGAQVTYLDLRDLKLPLYDGDDEEQNGLPEGAVRLKKMMVEHDGLLISSPEYNSSISGVLKNAIDWASRPAPGEPPLVAFDGKVAALLSASPGALGGLRGLVTMRSILGNIKVIVLPDQVAVSKAHEAFNDDGTMKNPKQQESVEKIGAGLAHFIARLKAGQ
ncbi:MAG TPA: NAD(P)H-dependent oxidoreductase [Terriglobales bacterium]|nr:NAD(P)H-dependent oxidoreductase [Terriglobales bacterium]